MDETNPAYENFRNKMTAFGQPIRGTTRKVAASKFLGRDLAAAIEINACLLYTSPSPRDRQKSRMPSSA